MKLIYIANTRIPTEKAHGWAIMKMCESFARSGAEVELVIPRRRNPQFEGVDPFAHYSTERTFSIVQLPAAQKGFLWTDLIRFRLPHLLSLCLGLMQNWFFVRECKKYLRGIARDGSNDAVIFSREQRLLYLLRELPHKMFYEIHDFPELRYTWYQRLFKRVNGVVVTNQWKKEELVKRFGLPQEKICVAPNAVDVALFTNPLSKIEARWHLRELRGKRDKKIALYVGGFQRWKGVYVLGEVLQYLPEDIEVHFVGGGAEPARTQFVEWLQKNGKGNYVVHSAVPHWGISLWLWAADVLVAPGTAEDSNALYYTSPLKLPEYVASGRPVVAADLPSVKEVMKEFIDEPFLVPPDDAAALADAIVSYTEGTRVWHAPSPEKLARHTWEARARTILTFLRTCQP